jgi:hypothetical protein
MQNCGGQKPGFSSKRESERRKGIFSPYCANGFSQKSRDCRFKIPEITLALHGWMVRAVELSPL